MTKTLTKNIYNLNGQYNCLCAGSFHNIIQTWYTSSTSEEKLAAKNFIKDMDAKYGKGQHDYKLPSPNDVRTMYFHGVEFEMKVVKNSSGDLHMTLAVANENSSAMNIAFDGKLDRSL